VSVSIDARTSGREQSMSSSFSRRVGATAEGSRTRLLESPIALVEDLRSPALRAGRSQEQFSPDFQVCLPYRGLFVWHAGGEDVIGDANQVLFVAGGESFHVSQPRSNDYAELIITPDRALLEEMADSGGSSLSLHPLFRHRSRHVGFELQRLRARFLHEALSADASAPALEDCTLMLLRAALENDSRASQPTGATRRLIRCTKEFLHANLSRPIRLLDIARAVGASPAYLTDVFRRLEGIPLHGYLNQLRLARALIELPNASDLTSLALSLGFSSHSHFSAVFGKAFGCTPSQFRRSARSGTASGPSPSFASRMR
jgi:AraC family transcriptional regulator